MTPWIQQFVTILARRLIMEDKLLLIILLQNVEQVLSSLQGKVMSDMDNLMTIELWAQTLCNYLSTDNAKRWIIDEVCKYLDKSQKLSGCIDQSLKEMPPQQS